MFKKENKREFGQQLENFARTQVEKKGYKIIETNFTCKLGEIDIIAQNKNLLIFIEVRYRKNNSFGGAIESVDYRKQSKLIKTASLYLQQKNLTNKVQCRFDVFALQGQLPNPSYKWLTNAFTA
ncbi:YraN family protein [Aliikangiella sp. IMCC44359]|uniref:YraN family protein n=1 Tax=Aliikangiella sp. IMCC44359 TaxID=3459125 RepID=UPI00403AD0FF